MDSAVASSTGSGDRRIVVASIGTAGPAAAAAVAKGLGVPIPRVVTNLYRAPSILAENVPGETADVMVQLLERIGFVAHSEPQDLPPLTPTRLFDAAIHVTDAASLQSAAEALAAFVGTEIGAALEMILAPPGLVLGAVSDATIEAFRARLPEGVELVSARPETSTYHVFLLDGPAVVRERLMPDLARIGVPGDAAPGLVALDVSHAEARELWRAHQGGGLLRVVNSAFLRYDVVLLEAAPGAAGDPAVAQALHAEADMPAEVVPAVLEALPITLSEGVAEAEVADRLARLAAAGLSARAELTTFQQLGLEVRSAQDQAALVNVMRRFELLASNARPPAPPFALDRRLPELQARMLRAAFEDAGAEVAWIEGSS